MVAAAAGAGGGAAIDALTAALLLALAGFVAGALNMVAAGGSFLTLPVLIFLGLPATDANATNRIAVVMQNVGGVWAFHRYRVLDWRWVGAVVGPALAGAAVGAWAALQVGDHAFQRLLAVLMVAVTGWTLLDRRAREGGPPPAPRLGPAGLRVAFFFVGVYGGFVQAGVGFLVLAATLAAGLDLVRGNAAKVLAILLVTALSLAIFAGAGKVRWATGALLGIGSLAGSLVGARLTVTRGHAWLQGVVTATVVVLAVLLWVNG